MPGIIKSSSRFVWYKVDKFIQSTFRCTFGLEEAASMIILSPTLIPRLAMVTSSTSGDCVLEDCFTVAMPLGEGAVRESESEKERGRERERDSE